MHSQHVLATHRLRENERLRTIRIENDLHQPFAIAKINEDDAAMIAATVHPAAENNSLPQVGLVQFSTAVGAHNRSIRQEKRPIVRTTATQRKGVKLAAHPADQSAADDVFPVDAAAGLSPEPVAFSDVFASPDDDSPAPARFRFFSLPPLKSVSYQPPPFRRKPAADTSFVSAD
jgi:hypothetical protein